MTPERFHDLLDRSTVDAPPAPPVSADLEAGRRRLRRRTWAQAATGALAVVVVLGGVGLATRTASGDRGSDPVDRPSATTGPSATPTASGQAVVPPVPGGWTPARVLDACSDLPPGYFDGPEALVATEVTAFQVRAAVESRDGRYWAECTVPLGGDEPATVVPYDSTGTPYGGFVSSLGPGCPAPADSSCGLYSFDSVDRISPDVKMIRVDLVDGSSATFQVHRGYVAINLLHPLPPGASVDDVGRLVGMDSMTAVHRLTYLDGSGAPLAAVALDGSGEGTLGMTVDGLPYALDAYPSLRGEL